MQESISFSEIRKTKQLEYGTAYKDWMPMFVKQYRDRTHFLFELLQNAEDTQATTVYIQLCYDKLILEHNGALFTKDDVISITKVAKSSKAKENTIGKFGIGFKSVYAYTTDPQIYSGDYNFEIRDYIFPYEIPSVNVRSGFTKIVLPFDQPDVDMEKAYAEISAALKSQINTDSILFLNCIDTINITIEHGGPDICIRKEAKEYTRGFSNVLSLSLLYQAGAQYRQESYLLFTDCEEEAVKIAFLTKNGQIIPVYNTKVYTFFPTDKESHQSFYIHAPFETTPARDNIVEDSVANKKYINNICDGLQMAFCWLRDNGYLTMACLNAVYPTFEYPKNTIFYTIYEKAVSLIRDGEPLIPVNHEAVFKSITDVIIPENMTIVECFSDDDIHELFNKQRIFWIAKEFSRDSCQTIRAFLRNNFDYKIYTWKDVVSQLTGRFLEKKQKSWYIQLFDAIRPFAVIKTRSNAKHEIDVSKIPFIRLSTGKNITAFIDGKPTVYLNNPENCPNRIDALFLDDQTIRDFYADNLRVPEYNVVRIVTDSILPKYQNKSSVNVTLEENINDLKAIKDALQAAPYIRDSIGQYYILTDETDWYKPSELHIPQNFDGIQVVDYRLIYGTLKLYFFTLNYEQDYKLNKSFFVDIGCAQGLMQLHTDKNTYLQYVQKYLGSKAKDELSSKIFSKNYIQDSFWEIVYEGMPEIFNNMDKSRSVLIARTFNSKINSFTIQGDLTAANDQYFNGANVDTLHAYSLAGLLLSFTPWLYTKDGSLDSPVNLYRRDLLPIYEKDARRLLDKLPFKEEDKATEEILSRYDNPEDREMLKELLTNSDTLTKITKAWQEQKLREQRKQQKAKKTPAELLEEQSQKHRTPSSSANSTDETPEAVVNPERRKEKLEKEFQESMDFKLGIPKTKLRFTYREQITPEEKTFLLMEYNGVCQICGTKIFKADGSPYFEAINILRTSELAEQYTGSISLGWNSLCLCPNCAAKYLYGSKNMSCFTEQIQEQQVNAREEKYFYLHITLQDKSERIRYTPKHFLALKTALEFYNK